MLTLQGCLVASIITQMNRNIGIILHVPWNMVRAQNIRRPPPFNLLLVIVIIDSIIYPAGILGSRQNFYFVLSCVMIIFLPHSLVLFFHLVILSFVYSASFIGSQKAQRWKKGQDILYYF